MSVEIMKLLDVCDFQGGTQPPKEEWVDNPQEGYVRMLQIRDYSQGDEKFIQYVKDNGKLHKCKSDDIMLSRYGYIGQAFIGLSGAYNVALVKVIKRREVNTRYLYHYFRSYYFQHFLLSNVGARATIPGFNKSELSNALIPMPNSNEQEKIASALDKIDALRDKVEKQYGFFDKLVKSQFIEMFGTVVSNEKKFPMKQLHELCQKITDGKHGGCEMKENSGFYFVGAREIYNDDIHYENAPQISESSFGADYKRCDLRQGDLVIVNTGATIGKSAIVNNRLAERTLLQKSVALLRVKRDVLSAAFLKYCYTVNPELYRVKSGSAQPNLLLSRIKSTVIPLPPIALQKEFVRFVEQTDKSKNGSEFEVAA